MAMRSTRWLIDKSALARLHVTADSQEWITRIERGLVYVSTPTLLEIGFSARSAVDWNERVAHPPIALMPLANVTPASEARALEVQSLLVAQGLHRAPSVPDLLIAAIAEDSGLVVLHLDKDFDIIAEVTGQRVETLRPPSG